MCKIWLALILIYEQKKSSIKSILFFKSKLKNNYL